jgi:hypothetical protein
MARRGYVGGSGYPIQGPLLGCGDILRVVFYDFGMALLEFFGWLGAVVVNVLCWVFAAFLQLLRFTPEFMVIILALVTCMFLYQAAWEAYEYDVMRYISQGCAEPPHEGTKYY